MGGLLQALHAHHLAEAGNHPVQNTHGRVRGHIPGGNAGAAGGEDQVETAAVAPTP